MNKVVHYNPFMSWEYGDLGRSKYVHARCGARVARLSVVTDKVKVTCKNCLRTMKRSFEDMETN